MFHRISKPTQTNSYFLFGPRGTGKTTLLKKVFPPNNSLYIDLLDPIEEDTFQKNPLELKNRLDALPPETDWIIIDEIQKVPRLLDLVHQLIENSNLKFALTGSSGRKLKRGVSNLLAGRAFVYHLFPLLYTELDKHFNLENVLQWGTLPKIYQYDKPDDKIEFLRAYALTYLKEEIIAEQIIRKLNPFRYFLEVAAQCNGKIINYSKIAQDIGVDTKTVQSYYEILEDTLIGLILPPYHRSLRKRQRANPKFYFFDLGVKRALERTLTLPIQEGTYAYGEAFEHFIILEIYRLSQYARNDWQFFYLRTKDNAEIDLIIERPGASTLLIEIKSSRSVSERDISTLIQFAKGSDEFDAVLISRDPHEKKIHDVWCLPWEKAFETFGLMYR